MDKRPGHATPAVRAAIDSIGATLPFLAPYGPDVAPIEQACSNLKSHLRTAPGRTIHALCTSLHRRGAARDGPGGDHRPGRIPRAF